MITTRDELIEALNTTFQYPFQKASISNQTAGSYTSLWKAAGQPGAGSNPTTAALCDNTLAGTIPFTNPTNPVYKYLARLSAYTGASGTIFELHDRLAHMGGLSGTSTSPQTVSVDVTGSSSNINNRRGASDYSEVQWWLEWYSDTGATASNATIAVTYDDASTGNLALVAVGGTVRASRLIPLPSAVAGRHIRSVDTITLSGTTGTAGNFGVTATRQLGQIVLGTLNVGAMKDWAELGLPRIENSAALAGIILAGAATTTAIYAWARVVEK